MNDNGNLKKKNYGVLTYQTFIVRKIIGKTGNILLNEWKKKRYFKEETNRSKTNCPTIEEKEKRTIHKTTKSQQYLNLR